MCGERKGSRGDEADRLLGDVNDAADAEGCAPVLEVDPGGDCGWSRGRVAQIGVAEIVEGLLDVGAGEVGSGDVAGEVGVEFDGFLGLVAGPNVRARVLVGEDLVRLAGGVHQREGAVGDVIGCGRGQVDRGVDGLLSLQFG